MIECYTGLVLKIVLFCLYLPKIRNLLCFLALFRKREEGKGKKKKKRGNKEEKNKVVDIRKPHSMLEDDHGEGEG